MWDLQRELWHAQDAAAELGHKLGSFEHVNSLAGAWKSVCERCGRVCIVARPVGDSGASRSGDALTEPCRPHVPGPEGGEAVPRRPVGSSRPTAMRRAA